MLQEAAIKNIMKILSITKDKEASSSKGNIRENSHITMRISMTIDLTRARPRVRVMVEIDLSEIESQEHTTMKSIRSSTSLA